jgi:hypothetical protein
MHIDKTLTHASETWTLTKRDRKQINVFERKVYRRILGPVYDNEKENWKILTDKEDSFSGLVVSMLASGSRVRGFEPDRSCWIFSDVKKSSACLPSEGK